MQFHGGYSFVQDCEVYVLHKRWPPCFAGTAALVGASACIMWVHLSGQPIGRGPCAHGPVVDASAFFQLASFTEDLSESNVT